MKKIQQLTFDNTNRSLDGSFGALTKNKINKLMKTKPNAYALK